MKKVQFSLRRIDYVRSRSHHGEYDSGRESPVPRAGSAIVRRRRHRSAKTWSKNVKTIHPKSSRASIEQLMKLILEQGETIQQQLSKLRDRENEIASFENEHRTHRRHVENRMGKNYLLETYLNGLLEVYADSGENTEDGGEQSANNNNANGIDEIDKVITTPGNSDSGVNTEDIATSPEVCLSSQLTNGSSTSSADNNNDGKRTCITAKLMDTKSLKDICKRLTTKKGKKEKNQSTSREEKLIDEHKSRKEFCEKMEKINKDNANENARKPLNEHLAGQIELLEKVIAINKHIQREEELLVRLNAKIRKYEFDDPNLTETEMRRALEQINTNIETSNSELVKTEQELNASDQMLMTKSKIVKELSCELEALEIDIHTNQNLIQVPSHHIQIHSTNTEESHDIQQNQIEQFQHHHKNPHQIQQQSHVPSTHQTNETNQMPIAILSSNSNNSMKTGTLPKLISSVFKKNTPINSGTIPKTHHRNMCNQIPSPNIERTTNTTSIPSNNTAIYIANQSFHLPDHVILSQAPLFFQKDTFNGNFMQSTDQRNINNNKNKSPTTITNNTNYSNHTISNLTDNNSINLNNMNINPSMPSCEKVGTKKLINGFYKDPDTGNPGLSLLGEDGLLQNIGTLV
ncbi:probable WRKY transcription factor protein 1 [Contarinia nasturtii]|uniref:probable WRKY transcription factor protein 1 n=1 Tax=Contarinia nasturtii TaxID=265458 RepID=UPI0012D3F126|nr:probable WRKY transcription factor protein 1 [Contarinia nasturtii]